MTTKVKGTEGIEFPDATVQGSAAVSAFIGSNQSLTTDGYQKLPGGLIIQWGLTSNNNSQGSGLSAVFFPIPFPNAVLNVTLEAFVANPSYGFYSARTQIGVSALDYTIIVWYGANNAITTDQAAANWIAIGY